MGESSIAEEREERGRVGRGWVGRGRMGRGRMGRGRRGRMGRGRVGEYSIVHQRGCWDGSGHNDGRSQNEWQYSYISCAEHFYLCALCYFFTPKIVMVLFGC